MILHQVWKIDRKMNFRTTLGVYLYWIFGRWQPFREFIWISVMCQLVLLPKPHGFLLVVGIIEGILVGRSHMVAIVDLFSSLLGLVPACFYTLLPLYCVIHLSNEQCQALSSPDCESCDPRDAKFLMVSLELLVSESTPSALPLHCGELILIWVSIFTTIWFQFFLNFNSSSKSIVEGWGFLYFKIHDIFSWTLSILIRQWKVMDFWIAAPLVLPIWIVLCTSRYSSKKAMLLGKRRRIEYILCSWKSCW